jgi:nucleoside-diphosphate-sugar epimerase
MKATVLGAQGFIGSHLVVYLEEHGAEVFAPRKNDPAIFARSLGHVFYCAGLTADFRQKPVETIRAHVSYLLEVLERAEYDSLLYLSSTRVYAGSERAREEENLRVNPSDPSDLYNLSKLTGEAACLAFVNNNVRIARLSNVYGVGMDPLSFLASLVEDAVARGKILLGTSRQSAKDFVWVKDVAEVLPKIALSGKHRIYNVAAGRNVSTDEILRSLTRSTGCAVDVVANAPTVKFPEISIDRIREEFGFAPTSIDDVIEDVIAEYRNKLETA